MTHEKLVEKVARAIWEGRDYAEECPAWEEIDELLAGREDEFPVRETYRKLARAAVAVVLEEAAERLRRLACIHSNPGIVLGLQQGVDAIRALGKE